MKRSPWGLWRWRAVRGKQGVSSPRSPQNISAKICTICEPICQSGDWRSQDLALSRSFVVLRAPSCPWRHCGAAGRSAYRPAPPFRSQPPSPRLHHKDASSWPTVTAIRPDGSTGFPAPAGRQCPVGACRPWRPESAASTDPAGPDQRDSGRRKPLPAGPG